MKRSIVFAAIAFSVAVAAFFPMRAAGMKKRSVQLVMWHSMSIYQGGTIERLVNEYNDLNGEVNVRLVFQGLYDDMKTKLSGASKTGDFPDIAQIAIEYLDVFVKGGKLEPITDYVSAEDKADVMPQFWEGVTRGREIYAFPFNQSVQVLYYNKEAFEKAGLDPEKPPRNWNEFVEYGKKLTVDLNKDGTTDQWGVLVSLEGVFGFTPLIRQVGGEFLDETRTKPLFDSAAGVRVMNLVRDLAFKHRIMPSNWTLFEGTNAFLQGKIVMGPITSAGIKFAEENLPWRLGIAPLPYIENKSVLLGGAGLAIFSKTAYKRMAAYDFIRWLSSTQNTVRWHKETGYLPLRKSALDTLELRSFHKEHPYYRVPIDQLPYARPPDFTPYLPQIDQAVRYAIDSIMINGSDPEKALRLAAQRVSDLLKSEAGK